MAQDVAGRQQQQEEPRRGGTAGDAWRYERFLKTIQQQTGLDRDHAERAGMATLESLAERITRARARELAEDLPERLRFWLEGATDHPGEAFGVDELIRRIAEREEVGIETATQHARAVLGALARVAPAYEIDDLVDDLPDEFESLLGDVAREIRGRTEPEIRTVDPIVEHVKHRADLDFVEAERALDVVLETLAERLTPTEVDDLEAVLPKQFAVALERGKVRAHGTPKAMSLDEFVDCVARKENVPFDEALGHTRAVFLTLAEAIPPRELREILHELPRGYRETLL